MKIKHILILSIFTTLLGFLLGKCSRIDESVDKTEEIIKYIPSDPIHDTIYQPEPYEVIKYEYEKETDTVYLYNEVDTAQILLDYFLLKKYKLDFSNDTLGEFMVDIEIAKNSLMSAKSYIRPNHKVTLKENTNYKIPLMQFYAMIGSSMDLKINNVLLGIDVKQKYLLGVSGVRMDDKFGLTINVGIKW